MIEVRIPGTPDACLSINSRKNWRVKARHTKAYRSTAKYSGIAVRSGNPIRGAIQVHYEFGWEKGRKRMDTDNAIGLGKCALDGLVDSGIMGDDRYVVGITVNQVRDPDGVGYLIIRITEVNT